MLTRFGIWKSQIVYIHYNGKIHGTTPFVSDDSVVFFTEEEVQKFSIKIEEL
jgi:predicted double-glycine peptidase